MIATTYAIKHEPKVNFLLLSPPIHQDKRDRRWTGIFFYGKISSATRIRFCMCSVFFMALCEIAFCQVMIIKWQNDEHVYNKISHCFRIKMHMQNQRRPQLLCYFIESHRYDGVGGGGDTQTLLPVGLPLFPGSLLYPSVRPCLPAQSRHSFRMLSYF